jgi:hypothetical protein
MVHLVLRQSDPGHIQESRRASDRVDGSDENKLYFLPYVEGGGWNIRPIMYLSEMLGGLRGPGFLTWNE